MHPCLARRPAGRCVVPADARGGAFDDRAVEALFSVFAPHPACVSGLLHCSSPPCCSSHGMIPDLRPPFGAGSSRCIGASSGEGGGASADSNRHSDATEAPQWRYRGNIVAPQRQHSGNTEATWWR